MMTFESSQIKSKQMIQNIYPIVQRATLFSSKHDFIIQL